ncbi:MAG: penicillin-binding protein 2 [Candidatus Marinimicrobia bacterium]|nr:penicillin-binding protein 2 [Candidatus Neomarinimicrobiota bacterium]
MNLPQAATLARRRNVLAAGIVLLMGGVGLRYFQLQILNHDQYRTHAEKNSIREVRLPAPRGLMFDRHGKFLVTNRSQYSLAVIPAEVRNSLDELSQLGRYLDISAETIGRIVAEADGPYRRFQPVTLYSDVGFTQRSHIEEHRLEFPGIFFVDEALRHYPSRARATHLIGYLRAISTEDFAQYRREGYYMGDVVGAAGLEREYERVLRGRDGYRYHLVDNLLRDLGAVPNKPTLRPTAGQDVHLSLDLDMQALGERLMEGRRGALIAMEPTSGEIYAYVSAPDYVLAPFTGPVPVALWQQWRDHPDKLLLNRPVNGLYPPGSVFKLVAAAAALAAGEIDPSATIECNGIYRFGNRNFHCNIWPGHGEVNLEDALRLSCNIYFYKLIQWIGFEAWEDMATRFGFGQPTGIEMPQESTGLVPDPSYMDRKYADVGWTAGHLLNLVLGQGDLLVSPLQIARMTAAIANGGRLVNPVLVRFPARPSRRKEYVELLPSIWRDLRAAMYQVVNGDQGTGFRAKVSGGDIFGKTGTAQNPHGAGHSWFTGFVKTISGNEMVVTILVEQGGLGSRTAAPLAAEMFRFYIDRYSNGAGDLAQVP